MTAVNTADYIHYGYKIASTYSNRGIPTDELQGLAMIALQEAALTYDPARATFATWARWHIRSKITNKFNCDKNKFNLYNRAAEFNVADLTYYSNNAPVDLSASEFETLTGDTSIEHLVLHKLDSEKLGKSLVQALDLLTPKQKYVIIERFYSNTDNLVGYKQIAAALGISHQAVESLERTALKNLRKILAYDKSSV